jgi:hypothetical protein
MSSETGIPKQDLKPHASGGTLLDRSVVPFGIGFE